MKIDQQTYMLLNDALKNYSEVNFELIKNILSTNIELTPTVLSIVSDFDKPFPLTKYETLIKLLLSNEKYTEEIFRVFFSKTNLEGLNSILFVNFISSKIYNSLLKLEDKSNIYLSIGEALSYTKNNNERYVVLDPNNHDLIPILKSLDKSFTPVIEKKLYALNYRTPDEFFKSLDVDVNNDNIKALYNLWWDSFNCRNRLFTLSMGLFREDYELVKGNLKKEREQPFTYYADYSTNLLRSFFEVYKEGQDFEKIDEIATFCFLYFNLDQDVFSKRFLVAANDDIYDILVDFMLTNPQSKLELFINEHKKLRYQKAWEFTVPYDGSESSGGGVSQIGDRFTLNDSPVVERILSPFFNKLIQVNMEDPNYYDELKGLLENKFLNNFETTPNNPILVKRAALPKMILSFLVLPPDNKGIIKAWLLKCINHRKGIPSCSESLFSHLFKLRDHINNHPENLDHVYDLILSDINLSDARLPTNVFVIKILLYLIKIGHKESEDLFLDLVKRDEYIERDEWHYNTFYNIGNISDYDYPFVLEIIYSFIKNDKWITSGGLWNINQIIPYIAEIYRKGGTEAKKIREKILNLSNKDHQTEVTQKICIQFLKNIAEQDPEDSVSMFYEIIGEYAPWEIFKEGRGSLISICDHIISRAKTASEDVIRDRLLNTACIFIEKFLDDPDPKTSEDDSEFNYHKQIERGEDTGIITSVRGHLCWAIQKLCVYSHKLDKAWEYTNKLLADPNLYVVMQAIVPFVEIVKRRDILTAYEQEQIELKAMNCLEKYGQYKAIADHLAHVFSYYRNLNETQAMKVVEYLKHTSQIGFFLIYFAYFRPDQFKEQGAFDGRLIKDKLFSFINNSSEVDVVASIFSKVNQIARENIDYLFRIIDIIEKYEHNPYLDERVLHHVFMTLYDVIKKDRDKKYYSDVLRLYEKYIEIEKKYINESFSKPEFRGSDIYFVDYYSLRILKEIYTISKRDFYNCLINMLKIDFTKNVHFNHNSIVKVFDDERDAEFLPSAIECLNILSTFNPRYYEIKNTFKDRI